jgi:hypothetical protein
MSPEPALVNRKCFSLVAGVLALVFGAALHGNSAGNDIDPQDPARVLQSYLRATFARDFVAAYGLISSEDKKVRDLNRYVQQRGAFSGFTLQAARKLSESIETRTVSQESAGDRFRRLRIHYRVPDMTKIAPALLNWDPFRLNSLSVADRDQLLATLTRKQQDRSLDMIEGEEVFELVKEKGNGWRMFLNWAAGVRIPLKLDLSRAGDLQVELSKREVVLQPGDVFEIKLKIRNSTSQPITTRIGHLVEPRRHADYLDFVQCGFLFPVTIPAGKEPEYYGTYMLRGSLPEGVRQLNLTYDFRILK